MQRHPNQQTQVGTWLRHSLIIVSACHIAMHIYSPCAAAGVGMVNNSSTACIAPCPPASHTCCPLLLLLVPSLLLLPSGTQRITHNPSSSNCYEVWSACSANLQARRHAVVLVHCWVAWISISMHSSMNPAGTAHAPALGPSLCEHGTANNI